MLFISKLKNTMHITILGIQNHKINDKQKNFCIKMYAIMYNRKKNTKKCKKNVKKNCINKRKLSA